MEAASSIFPYCYPSSWKPIEDFRATTNSAVSWNSWNLQMAAKRIEELAVQSCCLLVECVHQRIASASFLTWQCLIFLPYLQSWCCFTLVSFVSLFQWVPCFKLGGSLFSGGGASGETRVWLAWAELAACKACESSSCWLISSSV